MRALPGGGTEIRVHISDVHAVMLRLAEMTPAEFERASQQSLALTSPSSLQGTIPVFSAYCDDAMSQL